MATTQQVGNNTEGVGGFGDNPQNINPGGRPKNSLKSYVAKKLADMTPKEKDEFLKSVGKSEQWKMAEGSPHQTQDQKIEVIVPEPLLPDVEDASIKNNSNQQATEAQEED